MIIYKNTQINRTFENKNYNTIFSKLYLYIQTGSTEILELELHVEDKKSRIYNWGVILV